jgi:hypothetical protein
LVKASIFHILMTNKTWLCLTNIIAFVNND